MKARTTFLLCLMMFVEYFVWSSWYVTMSTYMGSAVHDPSTLSGLASGADIGDAYSALAIATIISPLFIGLIADRLFAAQRIMAVLHLVGAALLFLAPHIQNNGPFYWVILAYSLLYMPTIALSNSIAFYQMSDPGKQFPLIRVFGTIGWIVAGQVIGLFHWEKSGLLSNTFVLAAAASAFLGLLSFALPNTPPKGSEGGTSAGKALGTDALVLFKNRPYLIFFIAAILVCIPLSFYYGFANSFLNEIRFPDAASKMGLGQISEGVFILAIPLLFNRIGVKNMLLMGMTAWILRYVCFSYGNTGGNEWMLYAGIILHGVCYDFFFVTGYMYTEKKAGPGIKNAAQGLFTVATYGVGMWIGTKYSGYVVDAHKTNPDGSTHDWLGIWMVPAYIALGVLVYFILFFREKRLQPVAPPEPSLLKS